MSQDAKLVSVICGAFGVFLILAYAAWQFFISIIG